SSASAHAQLIDALETCREAMGILARRAEAESLDDEDAELGLHAVTATEDAFMSARNTTSLLQAWTHEDSIEPAWLTDPSETTPARWVNVTMWSLVALCVVLFVLL